MCALYALHVRPTCALGTYLCITSALGELQPTHVHGGDDTAFAHP